ncbi:hypothetical protein NDU88_004765 [Pleurodeles waltl]|uniref:Uncharacterized protein n=1 Tax=Pleurodeles waltl TaxID=8319 RepID=A0AAV7VH66_PLEWA|nr:hypothetical protein NDU88_004765 [Pleurodeles waltl]
MIRSHGGEQLRPTFGEAEEQGLPRGPEVWCRRRRESGPRAPSVRQSTAESYPRTVGEEEGPRGHQVSCRAWRGSDPAPDLCRGWAEKWSENGSSVDPGHCRCACCGLALYPLIQLRHYRWNPALEAGEEKGPGGTT